MDTGEMSEKQLKPFIINFIKHETFYLLIVLFVVALSGLQTWKGLRKQDGRPAERAVGLISEKDLRADQHQKLSSLRDRHFSAALPPLLWEGVKLFLFMAGIGVLIFLFLAYLLAYRRLACGVILAPQHRPYPSWGLWDVIKLAAIFVIGSMTFQNIFGVNPLTPYARLQEWIGEFFGRVLLVGVLLHIAIAERHAKPSDLGINGERILRNILLGFMGFVLLVPVSLFLQVAQWKIAQAHEQAVTIQAPVQALLMAPSLSLLFTGGIMVALVAPISEELLYRGFMQPALRRWLGSWGSIFIGASFFAVSHMDLYHLPQLLVLGIALAYLFDRTNSLIAPITLHIAVNTGAMLNIFSYRYVQSFFT